MSFNGSNIQNVKWGTVVDLYQTTLHTVVAFKMSVQPSGRPNQQWRITPASGGGNLFTIQSVFDGQYAGIAGYPDAGNQVIAGPTAMLWEIKFVGDYGNFNISIGVPNTNLMWSLASGDDSTKVTLAKSDGTAQQQWITRTALPPT